MNNIGNKTTPKKKTTCGYGNWTSYATPLLLIADPLYKKTYRYATHEIILSSLLLLKGIVSMNQIRDIKSVTKNKQWLYQNNKWSIKTSLL